MKNDFPDFTLRGKELIELFRDRIIVLDGAMGTMLQAQNLSAADFGGTEYEGCNEYLNLTRPDVVRQIHEAYFEAGSDMVETNTFGSMPTVLAEYNLADKSVEISEAAARIAREAAARFSRPCFVAGSMGPTTKTITVTGGITFDQLSDSYHKQAIGLLQGGVDALLLETSQDTRNVKAGIIGIHDAFRKTGIRVPLMISATIEPMGTMLAGQTIDAFYCSVEHSQMTSVGLNCATGPEFMADHLRTLDALAQCYISCYPNAGLPDETGRYNETPQMIASALSRFIEQGWVNVVGGCCGTNPKYITEIAKVARMGKPRVPAAYKKTHVSGIDYVECEESSRPLIVGERTNEVGSRKFRRLIESEKFEEAAELGRAQVRSGAQLIDVNLQNADRDESADVDSFYEKVIRMIKVPIMVDTTNSIALERSLTYCQGKSIINSINYEDGQDKLEKVIPLAKKYGAALIFGCIDEDKQQAQAITVERKLAIAERAYRDLTENYHFREEDIIWDPLVFPCGTGDVNYVGSAEQTIRAVAALKHKFPNTRTVLGISNVSFGLPEAGREVLNSVFLYHCTKAGLDFAIISSEKLMRYASIAEEDKRVCDDLLFNRGNDPVAAFAAHFRSKQKVVKAPVIKKTLDERLAGYIVEGTKEGLLDDLNEKLKTTKPLDIINGPLMKGMDEVGRLFNNNELIVAEVLQSAEAMKAAVAHLEQFMEKSESANKGKVILATVKGDVHDIGKNLVEIIFSNNGYNVINLGIKVAPDVLIQAIQQHRPDMVGLSGLLVKSAQQMVTTVEDLKAAGISLPVLVGGAALTRKFTFTRIFPSYGNLVGYARDAMKGLDLANSIMSDPQEVMKKAKVEAEELSGTAGANEAMSGVLLPPVRSTEIDATEPVRAVPDWQRHELEFRLSEVWPYLNKQMLYSKHLGLRGSVERLAEQQDPKYLEVERIVDEVMKQAEDGWLHCRCVYQYFGANSEGNRLLLFDEKGRQTGHWDFPRQQKQNGLSLADFVKPLATGERDSVALFVTTCGEGVRGRAEELKNRGEYVFSHTLQALAVETAEAAAERIHRKIREGWGLYDSPDLTMQDRFKARYQGIRVSFGYPACPNLADQELLFRLLNPQTIGVSLTEGYMMDPEASVSALVFHHRQARYFSVSGEIAGQ
ncbi:MAG: methionine synthase [Acidobacteria bacterium]|nr:MAG: methionine synthase [Acidobacteriota bacterium]